MKYFVLRTSVASFVASPSGLRQGAWAGAWRLSLALSGMAIDRSSGRAVSADALGPGQQVDVT